MIEFVAQKKSRLHADITAVRRDVQRDLQRRRMQAI